MSQRLAPASGGRGSRIEDAPIMSNEELDDFMVAIPLSQMDQDANIAEEEAAKKIQAIYAKSKWNARKEAGSSAEPAAATPGKRLSGKRLSGSRRSSATGGSKRKLSVGTGVIDSIDSSS